MATDSLVGTTVTLIRGARSFDECSGPAAFTALTEIPAGTRVVIVGTESHGSNPWRRYVGAVSAVEFPAPDGRPRHLSGLCVGLDF